MFRHPGAFGPIDAVSEHLAPAERRATAILSGALCRGGAQIAQIGPGAPESAGGGSEAGSWAEIPASRRPAREGGDFRRGRG